MFISLSANVALALAVGWTLKPATRPLPAMRGFTEVTVTRFEPVVGASVPAVSRPEVAAFHWNQLISDDLKLYRDRLREIGCPDQTVRRIILREIYDRFEPRRKAVLAGVQAQFWELALRDFKALEQVCEEPIQSLEEERDALIEEVLGDDKPEPVKAPAKLARANRTYDWLPEEKREQMAALDRKLNDARQAMYRAATSSGNGKPTPEAENAVKALEAEVTAARKQLLTPAEYEDYELRNSSAGRWSSNLAGVEATEEEWRSVARLVKQHDDAVREVNRKFSGNASDRPALTEAVQKLNNDLANARKEVLGPQRAAEFERGSSGDYQQLKAVLDRYGMQGEVAAQAYEMQLAAMTQANELRRNQGLAPEVRRAAVKAIRQETERSLAETLGARAFATYQKYDRGWFGKLSSVGEGE